jgi:hypothetical protein
MSETKSSETETPSLEERVSVLESLLKTPEGLRELLNRLLRIKNAALRKRNTGSDMFEDLQLAEDVEEMSPEELEELFEHWNLERKKGGPWWRAEK